MASFTEQIRLVFEAATGKATAEIAKLDRQLDKAGKTTTGFQGQLNRASSFMATNLSTAAVAAGTALTAFGVKSAQAFQQAALAADNFATTSGMAVEEASRWNEVAGDLGVNADAVARAMGLLNRAAASGALAEFGITTEDANERLTQTVQRLAAMRDETARAAAAQKLLGRSWQELAPLIAQAGELRQRLADVSDAKIIDEAEVDKARGLRDAMDTLKDAVDDVTLAVGENLATAVAGAVSDFERLKDLGESIEPDGGWFDTAGLEAGLDFINPGIRLGIQLGEALRGTADGAEDAAGELSNLNDLADDRALTRMAQQAERAAEATEELAEAQKEAARRREELSRAAEDGARRDREAAAEADAIREAARDVPRAELAVRDAERALADAVRDRDDAYKDSGDTLDDQADKLRRIADAQERVTRAKEDAAAGERDAARDVERARMALADAEREVTKAGNSNTDDGFKDALDRRRRAELDLEEALERQGRQRVDGQRDIAEAERDVVDAKAEARKHEKADLVDMAEMQDRITRAFLDLVDAQRELNDLRREAQGLPPIVAPVPGSGAVIDRVLGAASAGPRVDPITGVIPSRPGREGGVIINNTWNISDADPKSLAAKVDRELGRVMASGMFAGPRFGPS